MIARIENGVVIEFRDIELSDVPEHKRFLWVPVIYEGTGDLAETVVENDKVRIVASTPAALVPRTVTPYQARVVLSQAGLRDQVEVIVAQADQATKDAWEYGISVERNSPMIVSLGAALGLTDEQIDQLFIQAAQVQ